MQRAVAGVIELYDGNLTFVGPIERVVCWGYEQKHNELSAAQITLAADDEINAKIVVPASWARLYDGNEDLGYYRFASITSEEHAPGGTITYQLQSAQCTLLDSMLAGWHEIGGTGVTTQDVLGYILARQAKARWVLGTCDFSDQYQYNFEDVTLLEAIMSLGEVLLSDYRFVFDSTVTPWQVRLEKIPDEAYCSLVYRRNMTAISRSVDGAVVTRLHGRGYGEGDNQLTIASVNNGRDYIDADAASIARWGIREGVHVDTRQTDPATLKARMEQILAAGCSPQVSYEAQAIDLYRVTGESWDDVRCGARVLVLDEALGAPVTVKVTSRRKDDVEGDPGAVNYVLDNSRADTAEELNEILDRIGVHELYSQGATNMYSMQISDNADAEHPLLMRFYIPGNVLRINSCLITWQLEPFRTYATMTEAGGGYRRTSEAGGGATVSVPQTVSTSDVFTSGPNSGAAGSSIDKTTMQYNADGIYDETVFETEASEGTTGNNGEQSTGISRKDALTPMTETEATGVVWTGVVSEQTTGAPQNADGPFLTTEALKAGGTISDNTDVSGYTTPLASDLRHMHSMNHGHSFTGSAHSHSIGHWHLLDGHNHSVPTHKHNISHYHLLDGHTHAIGKHTHALPVHTHNFEHMHSVVVTVTVPALQFELEGHRHTVNIDDHTHELVYGVYEGDRAKALSLIVDGETVPADEISGDRELDVAKYLRKNDDGKVVRSTWHEVEFVPDGLTRITADLFFQVFIQSRGAGDY